MCILEVSKRREVVRTYLPSVTKKCTVMLSNSKPLVEGKDIAFTIQPQVGSTRAQAILSSLVNRFYLLDANSIQCQTPIQSQTSSGYVYVIHFAGKLAGRARHYIGFSEQLDRRLFVHRSGKGAKILNACNLQSISYGVVVVFENATRKFERFLKNRKKMAPHLSCFCPACLNELTLF